MNYVLLLLAILPAVVLLIYVYKKDTYEKESAGLLISLFVLGIVSTVTSMIVELAGEKFFSGLFGSNKGLVYQLVDAFIVIALVEEGFKFLFTYLRTWKDKEFNFKFDGIVYTVFTSLGFATIENILYVNQYGLNVAILRALFSVPAHAFFGIYMGYYYGLAKEQDAWGNKKKSKEYMALALIVPTVLHGFFDFIALSNSQSLSIAFIVFTSVLECFAIKRIKKSSDENHFIESKIKCKHCENLNDVNAFYCGYCGKPLRYIPYVERPVQKTILVNRNNNYDNSYYNGIENDFSYNANDGFNNVSNDSNNLNNNMNNNLYNYSNMDNNANNDVFKHNNVNIYANN